MRWLERGARTEAVGGEWNENRREGGGMDEEELWV